MGKKWKKAFFVLNIWTYWACSVIELPVFNLNWPFVGDGNRQQSRQTRLQTQRWWMHTLLDCSKQSCFIDKVLRRVSFQWTHENHPSIILILVHYDIQHESLHSEKDPLLLLLLGSRTEISLLPNKNSQKQQNGDWYCRYGY